MSKNFETKNTVDGKNQLSEHVYFYGDVENGSPRIMIMGNSITRHGYRPSIGWYGDWGMAASCEEKDYVHLLMSWVKERCPNACFAVVQAAVWEVSYTSCDYDEYFLEAKEFNPDIIVCAISANIHDFRQDDFIREMGRLHNYLGGDSYRLIQTTSFFNNEEKSNAIIEYVKCAGGDIVHIEDLCGDESNLAIGLFEHEGIQNHPGDKGMAAIAQRVFDVMKKYI